MRQLSYGTCSESVDEYVRIGDSTARDCLKLFAKHVVELYKDKFMRPTNQHKTRILLQTADALGFPGMLGSIDCCKWVWKNCPTSYHGQYKGKEKIPTITIEAICDDRLYFWHKFFGIAGCNNDLTVLDASPLIQKISERQYPLPCEYSVEKILRNQPYWLFDGIYPKYP